jgi:predicted DNA-binding protein
MKTTACTLDQIATQTIELPAQVAVMLKSEAQRSKKSIAQYLAQWLEDQADGREAAKIMQRIKEGKEKVYPADDVWARHGI